MPTPMTRALSTLALAAFMSAMLAPVALYAADDATRPLADVLNVDATVTTEIVPDLAVVTLAIVREGPDVAPLTSDVNQALVKAFAEARAVPGVIAANGGYTTQPRYDSRGGDNTRNGWQVRAQIVLKSKDFNALGALVGKLSQSLQIAGSSFEVSPELHDREGMALIERGARAFQDKALITAKAFGFSGYAVRQVTVGNPGQSYAPRPVMTMSSDARALKAPVPLPMEAGPVTLSLTVSGSLQMRK